MNKNILIIGGGAAGIAAALRAAQVNPSAHITIAEAMPQVGKKILVTGNGRCNLTNRDISAAHYHSSQLELLAPLVEAMPVERTLEFFAGLGLLFDEEDGRVYPYSHQAESVRETLLFALEQAGVTVCTGCRVRLVERTARGFSARTEDGRNFHADAVILTAGGRAAPKQGTNGMGFALAKRLGHHWAPLYPALTAIRCEAPAKELKGVRARGRLTLYNKGEQLGEDTGELQFTEYGISGIPAFQLSCLLGANPRGFALRVDLLPQFTQVELMRRIRQRTAAVPSAPLGRCLTGWLHGSLLASALRQAGLDKNRRAETLGVADAERLANVLKAWEFAVAGVLPWDKAQATGGGVLLEEIDARFASRVSPGLYLAGELLDVVGDCGGYNLHWAWCSGLTAGEAAAVKL